MAAEMAVEIMAQEEIQTEDRQAIVREGRASEKEAQQENVRRKGPTVSVRKEGLSGTVRKEGLMESVLKDALMANVLREGLTESVLREGPSETVRKDVPLETARREEAMEQEDLVQERISTTSATRMRAESER